MKPQLHTLFPARTRRRAPLIALVAAFAGSLMATDRPNILWIVSEDNTCSFVGAYGDPLARTPVIDGLAATGLLFTNAHSTSPVCAPTRSSIITGVFASSLGTQHMRSEYPHPPGVEFFPKYLRQAGYFCSNNGKTDYNTSTPYEGTWDEDGDSAHWRNRRPGQPFFSIFNVYDSHESNLHNRLPLITDPSQVRVPAYLPDTPETREDIAQYYDNVSRADARIGDVLRQLADDGLAEDTIVIYYSDNGGVLPRSKRFLYDNGTHVAMAARFPEKFRHLAPAAPGTRLSELVNLVDLAPTVLSLAGLPVPAYMQGRAIAGHSRADGPEYTLMMRDRMDERYDLSRALTDGRFRYVRNFRPDFANGREIAYLWRQASMREWARLHAAGRLDAAQRAFFEPKPPEHLFDCEADPDNVNDLARDPAHAETLARFRAALRAELIRIRDTGFMPESIMVGLAAGRSPSIVARDNSVYPLADLLDRIDALQLGTPTKEWSADMIRHPHPLFRYWGIVAAPDDGRTDILTMLADPDETVRLAVAEVMIRTHAPGHHLAWTEVADALAPARAAPLRLAAANIVAGRSDHPDEAFEALKRLPGLNERNFSEYFTNLVNLVTASRRPALPETGATAAVSF